MNASADDEGEVLAEADVVTEDGWDEVADLISGRDWKEGELVTYTIRLMPPTWFMNCIPYASRLVGVSV